MDLSYDGREFAGWARQTFPPDLRTVQGEIERVLGHLFRAPVEVTCAGRTDAGVHARGQVAHVDVATWPDALSAGRINRALPADIRVLSISRAPEGFDARFSALWRRYTYRVCDDGFGPEPLERYTILPWSRPLDCDAMNEAAGALLGEHDFASFCKPRDFSTTVRAIQRMEWQRSSDDLVTLTVQADAFCHSMVRSLVGVMLPVGDGRRPSSWPGEVLASGQRHPAVTVMPAYPLVLEAVGYPPDSEVLERQRQTRTLRTLGAAGAGC